MAVVLPFLHTLTRRPAAHTYSSHSYHKNPAMSLDPDRRGSLLAALGNHVDLSSPATLNLRRIHEQSAARPPAKDALKPTDAVASQPAKGKPRLLLMGQRRCAVLVSGQLESRADPRGIHRSGKSSISSVVFHKLPPNETLFLESTARIQKDSMASVPFLTIFRATDPSISLTPL